MHGSIWLKLRLNLFEIELIMCFLFKEGMRGGVSYIYKRYSKANNKNLNLMTQNKNKNRWYA